jgi:tRNA(Arg) A34 adenosine deaminase TadA
MIDPHELMQMAIDKTIEGIERGQSPFGCAIAVEDRILCVAHNQVWAATDITAHAEVTCIRGACRNLGAILLEGAIVATTCEPCPMCTSALHWARVETVYYGATIADAEEAGFNELTLPAADVLRLGGSSVRLVPETMRESCLDLFRRWRERGSAAY